MYKVPSDYSVEKVIVDGETVKNGKEAKLIHNPDRKPVAITISETKKAPNRRKIFRVIIKGYHLGCDSVVGQA